MNPTPQSITDPLTVRIAVDALPQVPDHELIQRIGSGSYGEVWLARNSLGTLRAVKIVHRAAFDDERPYEREFAGIRKFEPISRSHEGFVDLLQVGRNDAEGYFYYVMELADNAGAKRNDGVMENWSIGQSRTQLQHSNSYAPRTLAAEVKTRGALPLDECLRIARTLASALAELHAHGLVHRDIKPSNIIFVNGVPKLADIGLVAAANEARSFVGTEGFIPPEGPGSPQADLYSLGIVLYVISTGKSHRDFPEPPANLASRPDRERWLELQAIIHRACQTDPQMRYTGADVMLSDVERLIEGGSVRRWHTWRRNLNHAKRLALVSAGLAIVLALIYLLANRKPRPSDTAQPHFWPSTNDLANKEFFDGVRTLQNNEDNARAVLLFNSAIQRDPNFAEAWARLAWAHYSYGEADPNPLEGPAAARRAVEINPKVAYGHSMLATALANELNWAGADKERWEAIRLNPNSQEILLESALNLAIMGKTNEALRDVEKARFANTESFSIKREYFYGLVYGFCRRYDAALKIFGPSPSDDYFGNLHHALAYLGSGDFTNFMRFAKHAALAKAENPAQVNVEFDALTKAFEEGGSQKYWELSLTYESSKRDSDHLMRMAAIHAQLNQPDEAFRWLRRAMRDSPNMFATGLYTNPSFDRLRNEREFRQIEDELWREK